MAKKQEPLILRQGKLFHKLIQEEWLETAKSGIVKPEHRVLKTNGRSGRIDIFIDDFDDDLVSVAEIKATDWDRMEQKNVRRNIKRQARQVWGYIDSQIEFRGVSVCAGIIFPRIPKDPERLELIETLFEEEGIQVVWHNESIEEVRKRKLKDN